MEYVFVDGAVLRYEVCRSGLRMQDVAKSAGIDKSTLSTVANGRRCSKSTAEKIACALNVPVARLVTKNRR